MKSPLNYILPLFIVFFGIIQPLNAQGFQDKKANQYFEQTYYSKAIPLYEEVHNLQQKPEMLLNLADAYYFTFEVDKAIRTYRSFSKIYSKKMDNEQYFRYVQTLKASGKNKEAEEVVRTHLRSSEKEQQSFEEELNYLANVKGIGKRFDIKNLPLNTENSEFGGVIYQNKLVYAAAREASGLFQKTFYWNNQPYLNLYQIPLGEEEESKNGELFSKNLTTRFHESNAVFSSDGKTVYFTRNNYLNGHKKRDDEHVTQLQIYKAELKDNRWKNVTSLPINGKNYSTEHPALSPDGKTLYFSSNKPGGFGSFDLYKVSTDNFKNPENLGGTINTAHKEQFPFIDEDGNLYFSSDGHPGFGYLDVFVSKPDGNSFQKPDNIGLPINSGYDDFAFYLNAKTKTGFFSSNRPEGKGSDDIYSIKEELPLIIEDCHQFITGHVTDKNTGELLAQAKVRLLKGAEAIDSTITDRDASFKFKVECSENYTVTGEKPAYLDDEKTITTSDFRKKENDASLQLMSETQLVKIEKENEARKQRELEAQQKAEKIALQKQQKIEEKAKKERVKKIVEEETAIVKDEKKNRYFIKTEPIYFDYDLWYIRKESRVVLNRVVAIMNKYPNMKVEIGSHTDVRGNNQYNKDLSQKRSSSVLDYFESKGINTNRIVAKGYGETQPIIRCVPEDSCTEEQHEINRRCEFTILSFE